MRRDKVTGSGGVCVCCCFMPCTFLWAGKEGREGDGSGKKGGGERIRRGLAKMTGTPCFCEVDHKSGAQLGLAFSDHTHTQAYTPPLKQGAGPHCKWCRSGGPKEEAGCLPQFWCTTELCILKRQPPPTSPHSHSSYTFIHTYIRTR